MLGVDDTIVGLSSGSLPSGVAVIRLSGDRCRQIAVSMLGEVPGTRRANIFQIRDPNSGMVIDRGLALFFENPYSFTGEDCLELQVHGGKAVVAAIIRALTGFAGVRLAEAGEFTRRAFENGKLDLTAVEGLSDLVSAQTEEQRKQAVSQSSGEAREIYENWRERLTRVLALFAAEIDFVDEDDIPDNVSSAAVWEINGLICDIEAHLDNRRAGEIIHDGFRIVIMGKPNSGKSSLLNALAKRDVAIVTDVAGTTRDVLEVDLDIGGFHVIVSDTAGIRETEDKIEIEGIRRAYASRDIADLEIWLFDIGETPEKDFEMAASKLALISKDDEGNFPAGSSISAKTGYGLDWLIEEIAVRLGKLTACTETHLITRERHREALCAVVDRLKDAVACDVSQVELRVENLRLAGSSLGRITGFVDVEDLLDVIFSEFCVGK